MRYYIVTLNEKEVHAPVITNWYQTVPVSQFFQGKTWKIPFRNLLFVKDCGWEPRYLKILLSPFPLIHESVLPVFDAYGVKCIQKQMVFLDIRYEKAELYFLLQLLQINVKIKREFNQAFIRCNQRELIDCDAFYVIDNQKCFLVCSLALIESLIRQGLKGISLEPVEIRREDENGKEAGNRAY